MEKSKHIVALPMAIEDLTPEWFTSAFATRHSGLKVTGVSIKSVIWGSATKVFVDLTYATDPGPDGPPSRLVVKAGFTPELREIISDCYLTEAQFYRDIAGNLGTGGAPRCWFAATDFAHNQGIVLLEDLVAAGVRFGTPLEPWTPDLVATMLNLLATWHGETWNRRGLERYGWLTVGTIGVRTFIERSLTAEIFNSFMSLSQTSSIPVAYRNRERFLRGIRRMWELDDSSVLSLSHGDTHVGNTYITADGVPRFLDWQSVCLGPCMDDVTYFMGGALSTTDRRVHERDLLRYYLDALQRLGGPALSFADAWLDYRRHHLHGLGGWPFLTEEIQPVDKVTEFTERYAAAVADHDTFGALGV